MPSNNHNAVSDAIKKLAGTDGGDPIYIEDMEVTGVDEETRTCLCNSLKSNVEDIVVRLMASVDDGQLLIPAIESTVVVAYSLRTEPFVLMFSEVSKVLYIVGDQSFEITDGLTQINDGQYGGLVKVPELVQRMNKIEDALKGLIQDYNTHTHTGGTISGSTAIPATLSTQTVTDTQRSDIENTNVKHGKSN